MIRDEWRRAVLPALRGDVLDLGAGYGRALPQLTGCTSVTCVEPHPSRRLREQVRTAGARLDVAVAERLPYPDAAFDVVVCSAVLCSVADQAAALRQARRVLRADGSIVFFEHVGSAPGTWSRRLQRAIAPCSRLLDHGCDPSRDTVEMLREVFHIEELQSQSIRGLLGLETVLVSGRATVPPRTGA